jgi:putative ABC transport system substrate-binding protein
MRRREFFMLAGAAAVLPFAARAQQSKRLPRIGLILPQPRAPEVDEFLAGLRDLGWVDGETMHVEYRSAEGDDARLPALAAELVDMNVDVLVTAGSGVFAARRATATIPIVVAAAPDVVVLGFAVSLAHPGGNLTGQTFFLPQLIAKRLENLKAVAPSLTHAGVVMYRGSGANADVMRVVSVAAEALRVEVRPIELGGVGEFERAFPAAPSEPIGGFVTTDHTLFLFNADTLSAIAQKRGLPWIGAPSAAAHGALIGYGVDFLAMFRSSAVFVDKILKGAKPADIPIEQATKFSTIVNLKTAKALGVEIPAVLLAGADEVIE